MRHASTPLSMTMGHESCFDSAQHDNGGTSHASTPLSMTISCHPERSRRTQVKSVIRRQPLVHQRRLRRSRDLEVPLPAARRRARSPALGRAVRRLDQHRQVTTLAFAGAWLARGQRLTQDPARERLRALRGGLTLALHDSTGVYTHHAFIHINAVCGGGGRTARRLRQRRIVGLRTGTVDRPYVGPPRTRHDGSVGLPYRLDDHAALR